MLQQNGHKVEWNYAINQVEEAVELQVQTNELESEVIVEIPLEAEPWVTSGEGVKRVVNWWVTSDLIKTAVTDWVTATSVVRDWSVHLIWKPLKLYSV